MNYVYYYFFATVNKKTNEYSNTLLLGNIFLCASINLFFSRADRHIMTFGVFAESIAI